MNLSPEDLDLAIAALTAAKANPQQEFECQRLKTTTPEEWSPASPTWDLGMFRYRLAPTPPAPTVTPWTFADAPLTLKVRRKSDGKLCAAYAMGESVRVAYGYSDYGQFSYEEFARDFEQLNSQPCGVVEGGAK